MINLSYAQSSSVHGTVTDENAEPLPGVNILVKGTNKGTTTDSTGFYKLSVNPSDTLIFSFIGFKRQLVPVDGQNQIDISMSPSTLQSGEVVVVGYGTQKKSDLTGSVSTVQPDQVNATPTSNLQDALQGKVAGVQITPQSGAPGAQANVKIRGVGTLNDASPLYVVDGMLTDDISFLSPSNVKSVEVLKDASATAIYGSRGANGVIIITTKQGQQGKPNITFNSYAGTKMVSNKVDLVNAHQYAMLANELAQNENYAQMPFSNPDQYGAGTNWQDVIFQHAAVQNYNLTASGGSQDLTYNVSGNYYKEGGTIPGSDYERATLRLNNTYHLSDHIDFGHNIALSYVGRTDAPSGIVSEAYGADPTIPVYNSSGDYSNAGIRASTGNPAATLHYNKNDHYQYRTVGNAYVEATFLDHFDFKSSFGLDLSRTDNKTFSPQFFVSPTQQNQNSQLNVGEQRETNWLVENTLKYNQDWQNHSLKLLAGLTLQNYKYEDLGGSRLNFPGSSTEYWYLNAGEQTGQTNFNSAHSWGMLSYLFRANYAFKNRYLLTATYRIDGSSRFGKDYRYGHFPSLAVGWRVSDEPFMQNVPFISNLKLRASWGKVGNDKISSYPSVATITSNVNAVFGTNEEIAYGATQEELSNPDIRWEETDQKDAGIELGLFDNRFTAEVDYYNRQTNDILVRVPIPSYVGVSQEPYVNAASVVNRGFDFNVKWRQSLKDFSYNIGLVASTVHNEVLSLGQGREEIFAGGLVNEISSTTRTYVGGPIGAFYGYQVVGVFQNQQQINNSATRGGEQPGDLQYKDQLTIDTNGDGVPDKADGVITPEDRTYLGSPIPSFTFGVNLGASYKSFDFSANIDGQTGNKIFNAMKNVRFGIENFQASYLNRWTGEGTSNTEPRITNAGHNYLPSDRFVEDGDFIRLRNVEVGYTLPQNLISKINLRKLRLYVSGTNIVTLTKYSGYTPQVSGGSVIATGIDTGIYPTSTTYSVGVQASF
ncbi:MAG TPA: TonB-dependent receptor [Balneolaceae bacterium]|nr:TonB-dependent receptor [Balneolaceae bacterium]